MSIRDDAALINVMREFGVTESALLGIGGEACVFKLNAYEILRVNHSGISSETVDRRANLLAELSLSVDSVQFRIPRVLRTIESHGRISTIEPRLPGRPLSQVLGEVVGSQREHLIVALLECSKQMRAFQVGRAWYGDLSEPNPVRAASYRLYLEGRAAKSLAIAGSEFSKIVPELLASALPEPLAPSFVHLDLYPGNVLVDGLQVTAVVDFGMMPIVGDARLDTLSAVCYLTPFITPSATDHDRNVAREWLSHEQELQHLLDPARRWLAARWSHAKKDLRLHDWCKSVLLGCNCR